MLGLKYDDEHYIHNKNRDAIKKWILNPPTKHHEKLLEMAGFEPREGRTFEFDFDHCYYEDERDLWRACFEDLHINGDEANIFTFQYLLYALSRFLISSERLKMYKIHLKKIELGKDFTTN